MTTSEPASVTFEVIARESPWCTGTSGVWVDGGQGMADAVGVADGWGSGLTQLAELGAK